MNKANIEQVIKELFRDNYKLYPELYPLSAGQFVTAEAVINAQSVARGYWNTRNEGEIDRDEKAGVTEKNYIQWVMAELSSLTFGE